MSDCRRLVRNLGRGDFLLREKGEKTLFHSNITPFCGEIKGGNLEKKKF